MHLATARILFLSLMLVALPGLTQQAPSSNSLSITTKTLPKALLWETYMARLQASGGTEPYHWRVVRSSLPRTLWLSDDGILTGSLSQPGEFTFTVLARDNSNPPKQTEQKVVLRTETPLTADWSRKAQVSGQRIDGSIKVSNHSGRDFDLTFIVLAVNDIGRATAIGYQHFPLKKNTMDMEIPFGEALSSGNYAVNVDVVGEEPISEHIFRARLVTGRESVTQSP
ncbi:MAG TPA: putative Ig domain-containing protein [Terriglobales bacterium]|jgi:Putative Ig domain